MVFEEKFMEKHSSSESRELIELESTFKIPSATTGNIPHLKKTEEMKI